MSKHIKKTALTDLGFNDFFEKSHKYSKDKNLTPARIIAEHKESYILKNETSEFSAKITGKMMFTASSREDYPAVGDWGLISILDKNHAIIHEILPRKTVLKRKSAGNSDIQIIASNIDIAFIIQSVDRDYNLNRLDRYISITATDKIIPVIILNKTDLISEKELELKTAAVKNRFKDTDIFTTSVITGKGINNITNSIKNGLTYCFIGSSGVGKSSLINILLGKDLIKTSEISSHTNKGKHITTHRELFLLKTGGLVIDNPGMREIGLLHADTGIESVFSEILSLSQKCRFSNCTHIHEPGCAVLAAVKSDKLDKNKYKSYMKLVKENEHYNMTNLEKRQKNRKFGKLCKEVLKLKEKYKS